MIMLEERCHEIHVVTSLPNLDKGHIVPTHSMYALAQMLKDAGIDVINLVNLARDLHDYQYNGFEPDFSKYSRKKTF